MLPGADFLRRANARLRAFHMTIPTWAGRCAPGTIVSFQFPRNEDGLSGKARPCLVVAIPEGADRTNMVLAYGTTADSDANRGHDLCLADRAAWRSAGLHHPSRFVLGRRITVPIDDPRFENGPDGHPIIGQLPASRQTEFADLIRLIGPALDQDRLGGLPPLRARNGSERRTMYLRHRRSYATRPVIVEHRRSRRRSSNSSESAA